MSDQPQSSTVTNAVLAERIDHVLETVNKGFEKTALDFEGVHERQDTTNGKVIKANTDIATLTAQFQYNRIIWYMFTTCLSIIIALASYILFRR